MSTSWFGCPRCYSRPLSFLFFRTFFFYLSVVDVLIAGCYGVDLKIGFLAKNLPFFWGIL